MNNSLKASVLILLFIICSAHLLFADRREDFELLGPVLEVKNFKAAFFNKYGGWDLTPFFPFSSMLDRTADRFFDSDGYCLRAFYLRPDGESRYTAASKRNKNNELEKVCYDYLSNDAEKFIQKYDGSNRIIEQKWMKVGAGLYDSRYFKYTENINEEEAYGTSGHLYEKVFYQYDELGRCTGKEVKGYPYNILINQFEYKYDSESRLVESQVSGFDKRLIQKVYFFYDEKGHVKEKILNFRHKNKIEKKIFRYDTVFDNRGNWIEKIEIEVLKKHNRWVEEPRFYFKRTITYYSETL